MSGFEVRNSEAELYKFRVRIAVVALVVLLMFGVLLYRLFVLQVVRHDSFAERAESNRTAVVPIVPNRGQILDRNGIVLATNSRPTRWRLRAPRCRIWKPPSRSCRNWWKSPPATGASSSG